MLFWGWAMDRFTRGDVERAQWRHFLGMAVLSLPLAAAPRVSFFPITPGDTVLRDVQRFRLYDRFTDVQPGAIP